MRRINAILHARGEHETNVRYTDAIDSASGNATLAGDGWFARRDLPGCAEAQLELVIRSRSNRRVHAIMLAHFRDCLREWRELGGFLP